MIGVKDPGSLCRVSISSNEKRKIPFTLETVRALEGTWVGVNTSLTNKLAREAFDKKIVSDWLAYPEAKAEVKISKESRIDFVLSDGDRKLYLEVKNVSMARPPLAVFPDAVTERGQKHLKELMKLVGKNQKSEILFVTQRDDCTQFSPCDDIDPEYGKLLREAVKNGVRARCVKCEVSAEEIRITGEIPVVL
jgi:sugar fermentation stimulation protein A